jgi:hypothetical protein
MLGFWCPGCEGMHAIGTQLPGPVWTFDGNFEAPTFHPSIRVTSGHYCAGFQPGESCWCTFKDGHPERQSIRFGCGCCHSFVKAGNIEFLADSTHALAGKTVPLTVRPSYTSTMSKLPR